MNVHAAVHAGNIPALIPLLAMYTGDEKWLRPPYARCVAFARVGSASHGRAGGRAGRRPPAPSGTPTIRV